MLISRLRVISLFFALFIASFCFADCSGLVTGDIDGDCEVNFEDLLIMSDNWLDIFCVAPSCAADLDGLGNVNFVDMAILVDNWGALPLFINEILATNDSVNYDEQGDYDDWIEIYNPSDTAIDLAGMYLTDDLSNPDKWQFPSGCPVDTTINPGGYLLVWADENGSDGPLHANFKLDGDGELVALFDANEKLIDVLEFGVQNADVSHGCYPDAVNDIQFFSTPTPSASNNQQGIAGWPQQVEFSADGGIFTSSVEVAMTVSTPGASIYYRLDGQDPSTSDTLYTRPINITSTTRVSARAFATGLAPGPVTKDAYIKVDSTVANFNSNLPIVILDTDGFDINEEDDYTQDYPYRNVYSVFIEVDEATGRAHTTDEPDFAGRGGMKVRGQTSAGFSKKQYNFEIWDENDEDKDASIFGLPSDSDWVIHGPFSDQTLMRNYLTFKWSNEMGQYAPRTVYCEAFLNTSGGSVSYDDYVGVYIIMEKIKRGKDRVDVEKLNPTNSTEPEVSGGYILAFDKGGFTDSNGLKNYFSTSVYNKTVQYVYPDYDQLSAAQKSWLSGWFTDYETALQGDNFTDPINGYAKYIDVQSFIDHHILVELTRNVDGYGLSTFMYKDRNGKLTMGPAWDYNLSLGNCDYREGWNSEGWKDFYAVWFGRLFDDPEFRLKHWDRWFELRRSVLHTEKLEDDVDNTAAYLDESQARNFTRWNTLGSALWPNPKAPGTYTDGVNWMKDWLTADTWTLGGFTADKYGDAYYVTPYQGMGRVAWIDSQFPNPPTFNQQGGEVANGFTLRMNCDDGIIYYTTDGEQPHGPLTTSTEELIPAGSVWKYLDDGSNQGTAWRATSFNDSSWDSGPAELGYNEGDEATLISYGPNPSHKYTTYYFRHNFDLTAAEAASILSLDIWLVRDDGAVVYVNGQEVARSNMPTGTITYQTFASMAYGAGESTFYNFPIDPSILVAGENCVAVEVHQMDLTSSDVSFNLKLIAGVTAQGTPSASAMRYTTPVTLTKSTHVKARILEDGGLYPWSALNEATFSVGPIVDSLRITELMYHPADVNTEYIELKNIGTEAINLNLVHFTDGVDFTFGDYVLGAGEYVLVVEDSAAFTAKYGSGYPIAGEYEGSLDNGGEEIVLRDAAGTEIHDFDYKDSWYDITDGGGFSLAVADEYSIDVNDWDLKDGWRPSSQIDGTPGAGEDTSIPVLGSIVINEVLAHSHMAAPDWVELYNTTASPINIGGWFLSDSEADDPNMKKYEIAAGTIIGAGGYVVFYEDQDFGNPSDPGCNIPFGLSEGGETVYLRSGNGGEITGYIEQEDFGASDTGVAFGRYEKSGGTFNFVAMSYNTAGGANAYPKVGPVVINEIMYNPASDNADEEYVELHNITSSPVTLETYDDIYGVYVGWQLQNGIDYTFPLGTTIPAGGYLIVAKDPATFTATYGSMPAGVNVVGPYDGKLGNGGEKVDLMMAGDKEPGEDRYYIRVDRLNYSDGSHPEDFDGVTDPWPTSPDGGGDSLSRITPADYGNDVINWQGKSPTPGSAN